MRSEGPAANGALTRERSLTRTVRNRRAARRFQVARSDFADEEGESGPKNAMLAKKTHTQFKSRRSEIMGRKNR